MTIHSWGAVTPGMHNVDRQISCIKTCKPAFKRWKDTKVLIIDEGRWLCLSDVHAICSAYHALVSMVDGYLFDTLAKLADQLRNKRTDRPFGGIQVQLCILVWLVIGVAQKFIQLVVTGDFFQLPPVTKSGEEPFFAFESEAWKKCIDHTVTLTQVYRQKDTRALLVLRS